MLTKYALLEDEEDEALRCSTWMHPRYNIGRRSCHMIVPQIGVEDTDEGIGLTPMIDHTPWQ